MQKEKFSSKPVVSKSEFSDTTGMSLSVRGLLIAFPIVMLIIGGMAFLTYSSAIGDYRESATSELEIANEAAAERLRSELVLVSETESAASAIMESRLLADNPTRFDEVFIEADDGAFHSRPELWEGSELAGSVQLQGFGAFAAPPLPVGERRAVLMAAFDTIKAMANGLPSEIESLYFFTPTNDLLIFAPTREDRLSFYREAPSDLDFQSSEFVAITSPKANPEGELRCTSLQTPVYDSSGQNWTTGCMLPLRRDGKHVGAWGISIPLKNLTRVLPQPPSGALTIIATGDGKLIHHSGLSAGATENLVANLDLATSEDALLRGLARHISGGVGSEVEYAPELSAYVSGQRLEAPDWYVLTVLPETALSERAWAIAQRVIGVSAIAALMLGLLLAAVFHRTVARRIARLAARTDTVAEEMSSPSRRREGGEINQLEQAFDKMEERLEQARSREERSFDVMVDAAQGYAMALFDNSGSLIRANEGAFELFGKEEIAGRGKLLGLGGTENSPFAKEEVPGPTPRIFERELTEGRKVWLEETLVPLFDKEAEAFGTAYIAHDLTALRTAQRDAENNLLYLELAQSSAQAGHFSLNPGTMEVTLSAWLMEKLGIADTAIPLSEVASLIEDSRRDQTMALIADAIIAKSEFSFETVGIDAVGQSFPALIRGTAVFEDGEGGDLVAYFGIVQDISEQKTASAALERALDQAKAESRARSDILAVISHEIRTPISGILGLIDQVRRERSEPERRRALTLIEESSEALLKTLDATLNRTRNEREKASEVSEEFSPARLLETVAELFRPLARRKGLAIDVEVGSDEDVIGMPGRIQQVLANFLSNAVKFTSTGSITLSASPSEAGDQFWTFAVADTGSGIPPDRMETIFEPFAGSGPDTLGRSTGSGLGLSITRQLADELGGSVEAQAIEGGGTRMVLRIPLEPAIRDAASKTVRGTIVIDLDQASLAVRTEAIAESRGFCVSGDGSPSDLAVIVADAVTKLENSSAALKILVSVDRTIEEGGDFFVIPATQLLDKLPALLDKIDHE
ncbi:PAS domain-containing sensor histidine kinase [Qipengyuania aquimaris]|uniref:sensor histidine kinase n=1 Tax=Qipengyuania aquimaris TaxID=255984 RepID=UPI001C9650A6|nr:PAS domain-containing sensor histidine kinase [Qipengyuania aquimaris]MBY6127754.1 PAS domain-containing sensor histidine kinase [Qipengyuania aquimaris]